MVRALVRTLRALVRMLRAYWPRTRSGARAPSVCHPEDFDAGQGNVMAGPACNPLMSARVDRHAAVRRAQA
eukprot:9062310-Pyramimonas_sp.AAC.1